MRQVPLSLRQMAYYLLLYGIFAAEEANIAAEMAMEIADSEWFDHSGKGLEGAIYPQGYGRARAAALVFDFFEDAAGYSADVALPLPTEFPVVEKSHQVNTKGHVVKSDPFDEGRP